MRKLLQPAARTAVARAALGLALWVVLFPGSRGSPGTGLDPSYTLGLSETTARGLVHGRDVVYTYGPLGSLVLPVPRTTASIESLRLALHILFGLALALALRRVSLRRGLLFAGLLLVAYLAGLRAEYSLLFTLALLVAPEADRPSRLPLAAIVAGALVVVFALIKVSLGIAAVALVGAWLIELALRRPPFAGRTVATGLGALVASALLAIPLAFEAPRWALSWLRLQADLAAGYPIVMSIQGSALEVAADLLGLGANVFLWARAHRVRSALAPFWGVMLLPLFLAFRHGLIRQGGHGSIFPSFLLAILALGILLADRDDELRTGLSAWLVGLIVALPAATSFAGPAETSRYQLPFGIRGVENLTAVLASARRERRPEPTDVRALAPARLPAPLLSSIRAAGGSVDVLPMELSVLAANHFSWRPTPTLQLYLAYSPRLDHLDAEHFRSGRGADLLLVENRAIDRRQMLWDTPETWRAILERYERLPGPVATDRHTDWIVLRKRPRPTTFQLDRVGERTFSLAQPLEVPRGPGWRFAELHVDLSIGGRLAAMLWRVPPLYFEAQYEDGRKKVWRLVPATATEGLLMSPAARNPAELAALWDDPAPRSGIVRLRALGPGLPWFRSTARVVWWSGRLEGLEPTGDSGPTASSSGR